MLFCLVSQFLEDVILISSDSPSFKYDLTMELHRVCCFIGDVSSLQNNFVSKDRITFLILIRHHLLKQ